MSLASRLRRRLAVHPPAPPLAPPTATLPPPAIHGTYVGDGRMFVATTWGARIIASARDLSLTPDLLTHGSYDEPFTRFAQRELQTGDTAFDVGANIGLFTVLMAGLVGPRGRVVAYEPEPLNLALLRDNVSLNYMNDWVDVRGCAAAAEAGTATFFSTKRFKGNASLIEHDSEYFRYFGVDANEHIEVATEPLDVHVGTVKRIDLLKVDVEGGEYQVLAGAQKLLADRAIGRLCVEVLRSRMGDDWDPFVSLLRSLADGGWSISRLTAHGTRAPLGLEELIAEGRFPQVLLEPRP